VILQKTWELWEKNVVKKNTEFMMLYLEKHGFGEIMQMLHHHLHGDLLHDFTKKHDVSPSKNRDFNLRHGDVIMLRNMFFFRDGGIDRMIMKSIMCVVKGYHDLYHWFILFL